MKRRLLVTGGSSYLGQHLVPLAQSAYELVYTVFQNDPLPQRAGVVLDLRDETAVFSLVQQIKPHIIIHLAGSNRPHDMEAVIRQGTRAITAAAQKQHARLIHLSTDSIFNGEEAPYTEAAPPNPINNYGRAKADAEATVSQYANHVIVRTSLIYSLQKMDRGTSWMVTALQAGRPVTLFSNQRRNPVQANSLASACLELAEHPFTGIINIAGSQVLSRAAFALKMLDWWQIRQRDTLTVAPTDGQQWPLDCELDISLAQTVLKTPLPGVDDLLAQSG